MKRGRFFSLLTTLFFILTVQSASAADVEMTGNLGVTGSVSATSLSGDGAGVTNLDPAHITSGTANINISGNAATATTATSATTATTAGTANGVVPGGVTNDMLQNSSLTVSPGTGLSGGGSVSLGGSTTLDVNFSGTGSATTAARSDHDHDDVYQQKYAHVAVVALSGGDYDNPATAMTSYSDWCPSRSASNHCLLKIMPGGYDVGSSPVVMFPYIDIEGSGEKSTKITGAIDYPDGTITGANYAELRSLAVENTGTGPFGTIAIANDNVSPSILHVTAAASGGTYNYGVWNNAFASPTMMNVTATASGGANSYGVNNGTNSAPTMTNVTATASGGTNNYGVWNSNSVPVTMMNVTATASGGTNNYGVWNNHSLTTMTNVTATGSGGTVNYGVYVYFSAPTMTNVTATASGGTNYNYGVYVDFSPLTMTNVTATASGGTLGNYGVWNSTDSPGYAPTMTNVIAIASGGNESCGVWNSQSSPTMTNVTATASGGTYYSYGVNNQSCPSPIMTNVTATASGGTLGSYGVNDNSSSPTMTNVTATADIGVSNTGTGTVRINHSVIKGTTNSIWMNSGTILVGDTQLDGDVNVGGSGTITCAGVYDESYAFYANTCP